jgi:hypothetical protein
MGARTYRRQAIVRSDLVQENAAEFAAGDAELAESATDA